MTSKAILFGSIGVLAETSDIQRRAYNQAMAEAGLDWLWDKTTYRLLLRSPGGRDRLRQLSRAENIGLSESDIKAIHGRKTEIACREVVEKGILLRPGVATMINKASYEGLSLALVTTTYRANIDAIAEAAGPSLRLSEFKAVLTRDDCRRPKPAPDIYLEALARLNIEAADAIAIEDSAASVQAAKAAGIYTIATPGKFTAAQDFSAADRVLKSLWEVEPAVLAA